MTLPKTKEEQLGAMARRLAKTKDAAKEWEDRYWSMRIALEDTQEISEFQTKMLTQCDGLMREAQEFGEFLENVFQPGRPSCYEGLDFLIIPIEHVRGIRERANKLKEILSDAPPV
jgi:hypothetical protein